MAPIETAYTLAQRVLQIIVDGWPTDPDDAAPLPERQYVSFGQIAWDCEQLTVSVLRTYATEGDPAFETRFSGMPIFSHHAVALEVSIIRCQPTIPDGSDHPPVVDLQTAAYDALVDEGTLRDVLVSAQNAGDLGSPQGLSLGAWESQGPQGGVGGGALGVSLAAF